jgi:nitrate reductase / nitrite oxidoreductase, alpha subunit
VRYPYVRGPLLQMWREARARLGDPVLAWAEITGDPERTARYKGARGRGGFVRATWAEVSELIAAAHVHTVKEYGRIGWSGSRRSRRCRGCPTRPAPGSCR